MSVTPDLHERTRQEIALLTEEYRARISDINLQVELQQQVFALAITGIGVVLAAAPFIIQFQVTLLLGLSSLVFYGLSLTMLRHSRTIRASESYIAQRLVPEIQVRLNTLTPAEDDSIAGIYLWEWSTGGSRSAYTSYWWEFPIEAARYLIPVVAGIACFIAYWVIPSPRLFWVDAGILVLNVFWASYVIAVSLFLRRHHFD